MYEIKRLGGNGVCVATAHGLRIHAPAGGSRRRGHGE
jgi:hypothetical protein